MTMSREEAGRKGAEALNKDPQKKHEAAQKAAETRKANDPEAFKKMGAEGGKHSHRSSGSRSSEESER